MIGFTVGLLVGGFCGVVAAILCMIGNDRTESACAEAYEHGKREGALQACKKMECPAYERFIERGE